MAAETAQTDYTDYDDREITTFKELWSLIQLAKSRNELYKIIGSIYHIIGKNGDFGVMVKADGGLDIRPYDQCDWF